MAGERLLLGPGLAVMAHQLPVAESDAVAAAAAGCSGRPAHRVEGGHLVDHRNVQAG